MFRDRIFNISFIISFSWHVFCIFAFILVITPGGLTFNNFPQTSFLGGILESDMFRPDYSMKSSFMITPYKEDFASPGVIFGRSDYDINKYVMADSVADKEGFLDLPGQKQIPDFVVAAGGSLEPVASQNHVLVAASGIIIEGALTERRIVYNPPLDEKNMVADFKARVSKNGMVQGVERLSASSSLKNDIAAMRYVRAILFAPVDMDAPQEGIVRLRFTQDDKD